MSNKGVLCTTWEDKLTITDDPDVSVAVVGTSIFGNASTAQRSKAHSF